jgi:hypothetical protein
LKKLGISKESHVEEGSLNGNEVTADLQPDPSGLGEDIDLFSESEQSDPFRLGRFLREGTNRV